MLKPAQLYKDELQKKNIETWYDQRYMYYHSGTGAYDISLADNNCGQHQFVSVDKDDNVIGYISYRIDWQSLSADDFGIISYDIGNIEFAEDCYRAVCDLFEKYHMNRIGWKAGDNMSREILFKAKSTDNGEWVEGYYAIIGNRHVIIKKEPEDYFSDDGNLKNSYGNEVVEVDCTTICQYTGLNDKNDKKIWENDIVRYQFDNDDCPFPNKHTEKIIGRIFFSDFRASFSVTAGRNCSSMLNNDLFKYVQNGNRVEVIGNIFDNTEGGGQGLVNPLRKKMESEGENG